MTDPTPQPAEQSDRERAEKALSGWDRHDSDWSVLIDIVVAHSQSIRREALLAAAKVADEQDGIIAEDIAAAIRNLIDGGE